MHTLRSLKKQKKPIKTLKILDVFEKAFKVTSNVTTEKLQARLAYEIKALKQIAEQENAFLKEVISLFNPSLYIDRTQKGSKKD